MIDLLIRINDRLSSRAILLTFWAQFWLLNGLDKYFNIGLIRAASGDHLAYDYQGFFGVYRDEKFRMYFERIFRPEWSPEWLPDFFAFIALYGAGVVEVALGFSFLYILIRGDKAHSVINRLNFKLSMIMFLLFSVGDILFGDRQELWEHGTFLVLVIVSFEFFLFARRPEDQDVGLGGRMLGTLIDEERRDP